MAGSPRKQTVCGGAGQGVDQCIANVDGQSFGRRQQWTAAQRWLLTMRAFAGSKDSAKDRQNGTPTPRTTMLHGSDFEMRKARPRLSQKEDCRGCFEMLGVRPVLDRQVKLVATNPQTKSGTNGTALTGLSNLTF